MIILSKGQKINLTKEMPSLEKAIIGLGWNIKGYNGGHDFDLDASAFLIGSNGKVNNDLDFIFYNNLSHPSGGIIHMGDNRIGGAGGDDEQIAIDFSKIPNNIQKIVVAITIYNAKERNQNFGQVKNAFVRLVNKETEEEVLRYDLSEDFSIETALVFCEIYRHNEEWKFSATGSGFEGGLATLCEQYGLNAN